MKGALRIIMAPILLIGMTSLKLHNLITGDVFIIEHYVTND